MSSLSKSLFTIELSRSANHVLPLRARLEDHEGFVRVRAVAVAAAERGEQEGASHRGGVRGFAVLDERHL